MRDIQSVLLPDPSLMYRPEREESKFRNFETESYNDFEKVKETYRKMHTFQTMEFVKKKIADYAKFDKAEMTILDALFMLDKLIDESDPDIDVPNSIHAFQTAERIRQVHPNDDWFHLTGLIHDVGKVMAFYGEEQWSTVGDTFALGCAFNDKIVFGVKSFKDNVDTLNPSYSSENGIYEPKCGIDNLTLSWGHDEYMYRVLSNHTLCQLPPQALRIIRYHSFYPWHTGGAYRQFNTTADDETLKWVLEFNKFDLYSKADKLPDVPKLIPYYQSLIDKYVPGKVKF